MRYQILHFTFFDGWINCSKDEKGHPIFCESVKDAENEITDLISTMAEVGVQDYKKDQFKIIEVDE